MKPNPYKAWAIQCGKIIICGTWWTRKECIKHAEWNYRDRWKSLRQKGYRAIRVEVKPV